MSEVTEKVQEAIIGGLFGLIGTLVPIILTWTRERDVATRRLRLLDEATKRIQFWDQWLKISTQFSAPGDNSCAEMVQREIDSLGRFIENDSRSLHVQIAIQQGQNAIYQRKVRALPAWREWFLLYIPPRPLAWIPRLFFYGGLGCALILLTTLSALDQTFTLKDFFIAETIMVTLMIVFRFLSQWLEKSGHGSPSAVDTAHAPKAPESTIPAS